MKEKRISIRFRMDNEFDMRAWEYLEVAAREKNASKNSVALEIILSVLEGKDSNDAFAERIAELVVSKMDGAIIRREATREESSVVNMETTNKMKLSSRADEPEILGEDALDFLDIFG